MVIPTIIGATVQGEEVTVMPDSTQYHTNFFSPPSGFSRDNSKLISLMLVVWFVCVFGFQILLKVIEKPTPEANYNRYSELWPDYQKGILDIEGKKDMANIYLNLMARHISLRNNEMLQSAFTAIANDCMDDNLKTEYSSVLSERMTLRTELKTLKAQDPVNSETISKLDGQLSANYRLVQAMANKLAPLLGLNINDSMDKLHIGLIPWAVLPLDKGVLSADFITELPKIMAKHLIHNRSVLTDTKVLGFPLHYGYSAVFLLCLFVVLCIIYCIAFDKISHKHGIEKD